MRIDDDDVSNNNRLEELAYFKSKYKYENYYFMQLIDKNNQVKKKLNFQKKSF